MKVLVIYDLVPEIQKRAVVEMTEEEYHFFSKAHNVFVNNCNDTDGEDVALVIGAAFCDNENYREDYTSKLEQRYFGKWESNLENQDISGVSGLISCGFIL